MSKLKFYKCSHCGNTIEMIYDSGVNPVCCGDKMQLLTANTTDASQEKHVPVVTTEGNCVSVKVGSAEHPMVSEHYIQWIILETDKGVYRKNLSPEEKPAASFTIDTDNEKPVAVYEYCNIHGLWKKDL